MFVRDIAIAVGVDPKSRPAYDGVTTAIYRNAKNGRLFYKAGNGVIGLLEWRDTKGRTNHSNGSAQQSLLKVATA